MYPQDGTDVGSENSGTLTPAGIPGVAGSIHIFGDFLGAMSFHEILNPVSLQVT